MKPVSILVAAATLVSLVALDSSAWACKKKTSLAMSFNEPVHFTERHDLRDVDFAISTTNRKVDLLLTDRGVAMQLSDRVLHQIDRKQRDSDGDDNALGQIIKTAVLTSVRSVLSQSAEVDLSDIASADYRGGELIIKDWDGDRLFADQQSDNDDYVMRKFSEDDAREFVRELRSRLERQRR